MFSLPYHDDISEDALEFANDLINKSKSKVALNLEKPTKPTLLNAIDTSRLSLLSTDLSNAKAQLSHQDIRLLNLHLSNLYSLPINEKILKLLNASFDSLEAENSNVINDSLSLNRQRRLLQRKAGVKINDAIQKRNGILDRIVKVRRANQDLRNEIRLLKRG